jgi:hypothetical protein
MNRKSKSAQERTRKQTVWRKRKRRHETNHSRADAPAITQQLSTPMVARALPVTARPLLIPTNPALPIPLNARLSRKEAAAALTAHGFRVAALTLATKAVRGGGPPYERFGKYTSYVWGPTLKWAQGRLKPICGSTPDQKPHYTTDSSL